MWHFINVHGFIITGIIFIFMLLDTEQWRRIVPTSPLVLLQAWNTFVHYATFHLPAEPNGFYGYNALQQIAYFTVVFAFGPLAILTGIAMSPAVVNHFPWYARIFGGRQTARSIHFLTMLSFFAFLVVHVTLIVMTGFARNMNHIVLGTDDQGHMGMWQSVLLNSQGRTSGELAEILRAPRSKVSEWLARYQAHGLEGLLEGQRSGRPARLTSAQRQQLGDILDSGPVAYGLDTGVWTSPMIAWVMQEEFGIDYHPGHVRKLLHEIGFSVQRPKLR